MVRLLETLYWVKDYSLNDSNVYSINDQLMTEIMLLIDYSSITL